MFDWLIYPALMATTPCFYAAVGLPFAAILARHSRVLLCLAPIFGMSILAIVGSWYSLLEQPMNRPALLVAAVILGVTGLTMLLRNVRFVAHRLGRSISDVVTVRAAARVFGVVATPWFIAIAALTIFVLPIITTELLAGGFVTSFTSANNDLASYILQATNLQQAGFGPTEMIRDVDLPMVGSVGDLARFDHTGASALLASTAVFWGMPVWKSATVTVLSVSAAVFPAAYVMAYQVLRVRLRWCLVAACAGSVTIYFWYLVSQGFFAQITAVMLLLTQLALVVWMARKRCIWVAVALLPIPMAAAWYCSPEQELITIPLLVLGLLVGLIQGRQAYPSRNEGRFAWDYGRLIGWLALSVIVSLLLAVPRIKGAIDVVASVGKGDIAGWPMTFAGSLSALLGVEAASSPTDPNVQLEKLTYADALSAIAFVGLIAWIVATAARRRDGVTARVGLIVFPMVLLVAYGSLRWGTTAYQTWKLAFTLSFALLTLLYATWIALTRTMIARRLVGCTLLLLVFLSLINGQRMWEFNLSSSLVARSRMISPELVQLLQSPFMQRQEGANMKLNGYFETMVAPVVYDRRAALSGRYYFDDGFPDGQGFPFACTVLSRDLPRPESLSDARVVKRTRNYVVLGTGDCR